MWPLRHTTKSVFEMLRERVAVWIMKTTLGTRQETWTIKKFCLKNYFQGYLSSWKHIKSWGRGAISHEGMKFKQDIRTFRILQGLKEEEGRFKQKMSLVIYIRNKLSNTSVSWHHSYPVCVCVCVCEREREREREREIKTLKVLL